MIYNLRKKFIIISAVSVSIVFTIIFGIIYFVSTSQLDRTMDMLTDAISDNDGKFPDFKDGKAPPSPGGFQQELPFTPDTQFSTRFFTVWTDENNNIVGTDTEQISSVTKEEAETYAAKALESNDTRGWTSNYRYKIYNTSGGKTVVFVNGEINRGTTLRLLYLVFIVMVCSFVIILLLIILFSKKAVKPAAESYEKQRQFITDANHELKTPLTLILSNVDIVESETGKNEWLDDIRDEGKRMGVLINQLVTLSRMDEDIPEFSAEEFDLSNMVSDTVSEFEGLAKKKQKNLCASVEPDIRYVGEEGLIRRLLSILLDNALKYCDAEGRIDE